MEPTRTRRRAAPVLSGEIRARQVFARDWKKRTRTLSRLAHRAELSDDDVHDLRVTTRRLRASISVLEHCTRVKRGRSAFRALRALGRVLGERRMWDIALGDARRYRAPTEGIEQRRRTAGKKLARALEPKRVDALIADLRNVERAIATAPFERLGPWLQDFEWELAYQLMQSHRTAAARHRLRIEMKKVRYVLECMGRHSSSIQRLQDHLGREHDLAVLRLAIGRNAHVTRDARRLRLRANRAMAPALNSALRELHILGRSLVG